jgi:hypothetical protein
VKYGKLNFEKPRQIAPWTCSDRYPVRASVGALDTAQRPRGFEHQDFITADMRRLTNLRVGRLYTGEILIYFGSGS